MKICIWWYCNEGYDILIVVDMWRVFLERLVKGIFVCVCVVDEIKKILDVNKIEGFSKLYNI